MLLKLLFFLIPLTDFCIGEDNNNNSFTNNTNIYTSNNFTILTGEIFSVDNLCSDKYLILPILG